MFNLDGKRSKESIIAKTLIENSGLLLSPTESNESLALVLYREDPINRYLYLTAFGGLRQPEPMYGPFSWDDYRIDSYPTTHAINPIGFKKREGTVWVEKIAGHLWRLYVNGRQEASRKQFYSVEPQLTQALTSVFEDSKDQDRPLYPELWYKETLARDILRQSFRELGPGAPLKEMAKRITKALHDTFKIWWPKFSMNIGIYLDTGENWRLCGGNQLSPWLPETIDGLPEIKLEGDMAYWDNLNAFNWVGQSTRPVLLRHPLSKPWENRLRACGDDMSNVISNQYFSGMCIVPILHHQYHWQCLGIILMMGNSLDVQVHPSHVYLLSRLALGLSGYLGMLLPIPGFPWWPEAKTELGNAKVLKPLSAALTPDQVLLRVAKKAAQDLMPSNAEVEIISLRAGHSGAAVFKLIVYDERGILEIPRVMKVGPQKVIETELKGYYRYVYNKEVGGASRVDVARGSLWLGQGSGNRPRQDEMYGVIVYTFVGAGKQALSWSEWAKDAAKEGRVKEIEKGLTMLYDQLSCWYDRTKGNPSTVVDLLLKPLAEGGFQNYIKKVVTTPSFEDVWDKISELYIRSQKKVQLGSSRVVTCVVHDDLHADNIFTVLTTDGQIQYVGLIDWGLVRSGRHPLSDISKLLTDLVYRIDLSLRELAFNTIQQWGGTLRCGSEDWKFALIHQIAKIMFYRYEEDDSRPYISDAARLQAWKDLNKLADELMETQTMQPPSP